MTVATSNAPTLASSPATTAGKHAAGAGHSRRRTFLGRTVPGAGHSGVQCQAAGICSRVLPWAVITNPVTLASRILASTGYQMSPASGPTSQPPASCQCPLLVTTQNLQAVHLWNPLTC